MNLIDKVFWADEQDILPPEAIAGFLEELGLKRDEHFVIEDGRIVWRSSGRGVALTLCSFRDKITGEPGRLIYIHCPAVRIPREDCLPFYRRVLELAPEIPMLSIGVNGNTVSVSGVRSIEGMSRKELLFLLRMVELTVGQLREVIAPEFKAPLIEAN